MAEYGDSEFQRLETNRLKQEKEEEIIDFQNSKLLTKLEVFDELELRILFNPQTMKQPLKYAIQEGVIIVLDELNTHTEDDVYQIASDWNDFDDFMFEYFQPNHRDFETVYELLTKQEVISTLVRCKPAKYVFV